MYEHKRQPLASTKVYYRRILNNLRIGTLILMGCLALGVAGYMYFADMRWDDALHNASMILSGMGPLIDNPTALPVSAKLFSSAYALFSGVVFITNISFILAPAVHRFFHKLHVEEK